MTLGARWVRRPQSLWLRKALFQVHLWTGIGVGLYILVISVSGSVLVYRNELFRAFTARPIIVVGSGTRMNLEGLKEAAQRAYAGYEVTQAWEQKNPKQAVEIWLQRGGGKKRRLFDPYTGEDLGESIPRGIRFVSWLLDLHDNLLYGQTGRLFNGVGALLVTLLCLTGAVIWWPGMRTWRHSLTIPWKVNWRRLNWHLHSAIGFWTFALIFVWAITGVYFAFPQPFDAFVEFFEPLDESNPSPRRGDAILRWFVYLHFGRFGGGATKFLWAVLGVVPPLMFITGAVMWWNRTLRYFFYQKDSNVAEKVGGILSNSRASE